MATQPYTLVTCPDREKHTPCPSGYLEWHAWAEKKAKTHEQETCPTCGLYSIWKRKAAVPYDPELRFDLDNLITLCRDCHHDEHRKGVKP